MYVLLWLDICSYLWLKDGGGVWGSFGGVVEDNRYDEFVDFLVIDCFLFFIDEL